MDWVQRHHPDAWKEIFNSNPQTDTGAISTIIPDGELETPWDIIRGHNSGHSPSSHAQGISLGLLALEALTHVLEYTGPSAIYISDSGTANLLRPH